MKLRTWGRARTRATGLYPAYAGSLSEHRIVQQRRENQRFFLFSTLPGAQRAEELRLRGQHAGQQKEPLEQLLLGLEGDGQ